MLEYDTFLLRQVPGGVEPPIEVFDDADNLLAYIHFPARPMRGCLTILICVVTFFLFPIVTVWILGVICDWIDVVSPMDIDRRRSAVVLAAWWSHQELAPASARWRHWVASPWL